MADVPGGQFFPKAHRLRHRQEFQGLRQAGKKKHTPHFIVLHIVKKNGPTRLGLTVSKKVGGAVQRNRVKRLVREWFRRNHEHLPACTDFSIIAKKGAAAMDCAAVCGELDVISRGL